jgi:hypothetical protein
MFKIISGFGIIFYIFFSLVVVVNAEPVTNTATINSVTLDLNAQNNTAQATVDYEGDLTNPVVDLELNQTIDLVENSKAKINIQYINNSDFVVNNYQIIIEIEGIASDIEIFDENNNAIPFSIVFENGKYKITIDQTNLEPNMLKNFNVFAKISENANTIIVFSSIISSYSEEIMTNNTDNSSLKIPNKQDNSLIQVKIDPLLVRTGYAIGSYTSLIVFILLFIYFGIKFVINSNKI